MDISAKELSRQAIERVRVCEKVRFDFKMSQTPSVTLRVPPPSRGADLIRYKYLFRTKTNSLLSVTIVRITEPTEWLSLLGKRIRL